MLTFREYVKMKETAGDSYQTAPVQPIAALLRRDNAPIPGNTSGERPPGPDEQFSKFKKKKKRESDDPKFDNKFVQDDMNQEYRRRATELGVNP